MWLVPEAWIGRSTGSIFCQPIRPSLLRVHCYFAPASHAIHQEPDLLDRMSCFWNSMSAHGLEIWLGRHPSGGFWHPADVKKSTRRGSPRRRQQCKLHNDFDSTIRYPAPHYSYWRIKTAQYTPYRYDELQVAALSSANPQPTRSNTPLEFLQPHHSSTLSENLDVLPT